MGLEYNSFLLLLDYDNHIHGTTKPLPIITAWLDSIAARLSIAPALDIKVRAYGGWFEGHAVSESRTRAAIETQNSWPSFFIHAKRTCRINFEFADNIFENPQQRVTHTVAPRKFPPRVRRTAIAASCKHPGCNSAMLYRWLTSNKGCNLCLT